jgi:hypothetical protein
MMLMLPFLLPAAVEGRLLNLGGSLDLTYSYLDSKEGDNTFYTNSFQQRYNIRDFGDLIDPRIGSYNLGFTFFKQDVTTSNSTPDRDFSLFDYSAGLNLLPYVSPLSLYAQRVTSENQDGVVAKNRLTTYGANWALTIPRYPRLSISLNRSELRSEDRLRLPDTNTNFINVDTRHQIGNTSVSARYQFNQSDVARGDGTADSFNSNAINLDTDSQLTSRLVLSTFVRYASRGGSSATGLGFFPERGVGASLFWTPSLYWDSSARYEISEIPDGVAFRHQLGFLNVNIHPNQRTDILTSLRYYTFTTGSVTTEAPLGDFNVSWRPFFGLTTGAGASIGVTRSSGDITISESYFQRYRFYTNYTKTLTLIRYNASYTVSYGIDRTSRSGPGVPPTDNDQDLMNTVNVGIENTQIRIVHLATSVTFNDIQRSVTTVQQSQDQQSFVYQLSADSSYFRNIVFTGDGLQLFGITSVTNIKGFGADGSSFVLDGRATYTVLGIIGTLGFTHQDYPSGFYNDSDLFYQEAQWTASWMVLTALLDAKHTQQWGRGDSLLTRDGWEGTADLSGQIGQLFIGVDYRISNDDTADVRFLNQSLFVRVSRAF